MSGAPRLIVGGLHRDARGEVRHINAFAFEKVDRFYTVHPAVAGEVRGWVGHRREWKWFFVVQGVMEIGVVQPDDWHTPSSGLTVQQYTLSAEAPVILEIPAGFFTASIARENHSILQIFSTGKIERAKDDDFRLPAEFWPFRPVAANPATD